MKSGIVYDSIFSKHDTGIHHPEKDNRASYIFNQIKDEKFFNSIVKIPTQPCDPRFLEFAHHPAYLKLAKLELENGLNKLSTGDTAICKDSWTVASIASGGILNAIKQVSEHKIKNAFCITRPPGHHANEKKGMGFCIFNHVAIGARYAQKVLGYEKILIVDWDVHHGNGTQDIFYQDDSVFFFSTHQSPWYPGTGGSEETGSGKGLGFTKNFPFPSGSGSKEILEFAFSSKLPKFVSKFKPDLIIISAGFDSRKDDPLGQFKLNDEDFYNLTKVMIDLADEHCEGKLISVLEGGYNLKGLAHASISHLKALLEKDF